MMASFTRDDYKRIYDNAKYIYSQSRLPDVRRKAREMAMMAEDAIGQVDPQPAETWKD